MGRLRLRAEDTDDLAVLSSHLQDAILKVGDLAMLPRDRRFAFVANRFMWERAGPRPPYLRTRSGVAIGGVLKVQSQRIRQDAPEAVLNLLALVWTPGTDGAGVLTLEFAGGGAIRIEAECLDIEMSDLAEPWDTQAKPRHNPPE